MTERKQLVSADDNVSDKPSLTSGEETNYFDLIPVELVIINILSRLPVKSKAQCRCVWRLWSSIIRRPHYNELFPVKSPATPRLLLVFDIGDNLFFISSPQPNNPDEDSSLVPTLHDTVSAPHFFRFSHPVQGLICRQHVEKNYTRAVISNPITGEYLTLPGRRMDGAMSELKNGKVRYYFGYDPVLMQLKVLRITSSNWSYEYHILTLGTGNGNLLWRNVQCCLIHYPLESNVIGINNGICINGVLYYINGNKRTVVCFDIRSEKFSFVNIDQDLATKIGEPFSLRLTNYKDKLGVFVYDENLYRVFDLWVLEDAEKHIWSKHSYQVPVNAPFDVHPVGINGSGELVLCPMSTQDPFFVCYYNLERNIITRVILEVPFKYGRVHAFPNFVEDVKLM